jgi:hypothetical protein
MFRSNIVRTVFLVGIGMIAGLPLSAPAADGGPAIPAPSDQPAASQPAPSKQKPGVKSAAKSSKAVPSAPAQSIPPGTVIAPVDSEPEPASPPPGNSPAIPGLNQFLRPDGGFDLPGGVGIIRPEPDHIGIQINTPDGPFEFNVPRRRRAAQGADEAPGPDGEAPLPGGRAGVNSGRAGREFTIASRLFRARNYAATLRRVSRYLQRDPGDRDLLQLRSLTNFSLADYPAAYRDALAALADGDFWDWTTLRSLYRSSGEYTAQYRALEDYVTSNPKAAEPAFLFAYHNLMLGNQEAARREFGHVAAIDPANEAARRLATGERPPQPRSQTSRAPGAGMKTAPVPNGPQAPPQGAPSGGPSVDLGQPAPLGPQDNAGSKGAK